MWSVNPGRVRGTLGQQFQMPISGIGLDHSQEVPRHQVPQLYPQIIWLPSHTAFFHFFRHKFSLPGAFPLPLGSATAACLHQLIANAICHGHSGPLLRKASPSSLLSEVLILATVSPGHNVRLIGVRLIGEYLMSL